MNSHTGSLCLLCNHIKMSCKSISEFKGTTVMLSECATGNRNFLIPLDSGWWYIQKQGSDCMNIYLFMIYIVTQYDILFNNPKILRPYMSF